MDTSQIHAYHPGFELLPTRIDRLASEEPTKPWASIPADSQDLSKGFTDITYSQYANAINRASRWIEETLGQPEKGSFPTVAYMAPSDLRYYIIVIACIKVGYKCLLLLNGRNTTEGLLHLLKTTECHYFLHDQAVGLDTILRQRSMKDFVVSSEADLMSLKPVPEFHYSRRLEDGLNEPAMTTHTSGTTGLQKPVTLTQGALAYSIAVSSQPDSQGLWNMWPVVDGLRAFAGFPIAHGGGVVLSLMRSLYGGYTMVFTKGDPMSLSTLEGMLDYGHIKFATITPFTATLAARSSTTLSKLATLDALQYAGGALPEAVGEILSKHVYLMSGYGSTENMIPQTHVSSPEAWQYTHYDRRLVAIDWRLRDPDKNLYELVMLRHPDPKLRLLQPCFWIYPHLEEWPMSDLFSPHPTKPDHWKYEGRVDEMVILDSGHNFHPTSYEKEIFMKDPKVKDALILGNGRKNLVLIVDLVTKPANEQEAKQVKKEVIEPLVQECNRKSTTKASIPMGHVILATEDKPFPKAAKGNTQRKLAECLYKDEIEAVYRA